MNRPPPVRSRPLAIELSDELIELEKAAWAEQQENRLTVETVARVQVAITDHAEATEQNRYDVEQELKRVTGDIPSLTAADLRRGPAGFVAHQFGAAGPQRHRG
ncbi:hypothetical protein [Streptomyces sp. NBC_01637]|uniref:hypothetical protein n=1 Tax=unclassified Streptomyces TaxID=2593676 RepID=UPI00386D622C|nr:hypothetical protein OH719_02515 [Streptomyces sp. NBC_01653]WTD93923.1 hypothetical protein OG891_44345 [Streptomyces sp. NBC_01637]